MLKNAIVFKSWTFFDFQLHKKLIYFQKISACSFKSNFYKKNIFKFIDKFVSKLDICLPFLFLLRLFIFKYPYNSSLILWLLAALRYFMTHFNIWLYSYKRSLKSDYKYE